MRKFWELLKESVIIQGTVTLAFVFTACYLAIVGRDIPDWLYGFCGVALGYFFTSKAQRSAK